MRLLVASHDASRTGAPLLLLTFLLWLRRTTNVDVQLVLWRGGPLVDAFAEIVDLTVLHRPAGQRSPAETVEAGLSKVGLSGVADRSTEARVRRRLRVKEHDVIYLNGAGSALVAPHLQSTAPTVAHVHELDRGLNACLRGPGGERFLAATRFVAVAQVVADRLVDGWGVPSERVVVRHGCLPTRVADGPSVRPDLPDGVPLVLGVGSGSWRKGIDLFARVARGVRSAAGDVRFAWVGPLDGPVPAGPLDLPGEVADPDPWFRRADVFCSTAREDPFPLVGLEAGAAGVPVVSFDNGGLAELLADGRGTVVGAEDVEAMVAAVVEALRRPPPTEPLAAWVRERHTIDRLGPELLGVLESVR